MRVAIHSNQFDGRGTGKVPYDYAVGLRDLLGHEVVFITSSLSANEGLPRLQREFQAYTYDKKVDQHPGPDIRVALERIVADRKIDFVHFLKFGNDDQITPFNCRTGIHCVFVMNQPHGSVYAGVSESLARKFNSPLFVPHILKPFSPGRDMRSEWDIPTDAFVVGRHGGVETFDIPWVYAVIREALETRPDLYFVFLSTRPFCAHPRVRFIPWVESEQDKFDFIHSCDAMLHARLIGETFGLAVGEFSAANKPVMTWSGRGLRSYDVAHIDILGVKALVYKNRSDLLRFLVSLDRRELAQHDWDVYSERFSTPNVMDQYHRVFLSGSS